MRFRDFLAALVGLAVVGAIGFGAWTWLGDTIDGPEPTPEPGSDPAATAEAYLDAWEQGDHLAMVRYVRDPPDDFVARHVQLRDALEPTQLTITAGEDQAAEDGRARFPLEIGLEVPFADGPIGWDTSLELIRERGQWGVVWSLATIHPELRESWEFATETEEVSRQQIHAADGTVLSGTRTFVTFGFEPTAVQDPDEVIAAFAAAVPGSESAAARELGRDDLVDGWFYPVVTVAEHRAGDARAHVSGVPGILRRTDERRGLYDEHFAHHVVGVVAEATAEQLEQFGLDPQERHLIGQFGLERALEDRLLGSDIVRAGLRERDGVTDAPLRYVLSETQADPSAPVHTTLDVTVQQAIENALVGAGGTIGLVAVDADSSAILGSASRPLGGYNRAFEGRYPPGSTFKIVTAEALLREGGSPQDPVDCPAETSVGGLRIANAGDIGHGAVDLREAFARSCNTTFAQLGAELGDEALIAAAERFGFNDAWQLPLSSFGGSFPEPADTAERGAAAFGQARVETSVVHLAGVAAAAVSGEWRAPYLLQDDGPHEPRPLADGVAEPLQELLRAVVTDGTGTAAAVEGRDVLGKTGTAQASGGVEHAWFIGYYDGVAFAVLVEEGGSGGQVAAPIAARFVRELAALRGQVIDQPDDEDPDAANG